MVSSKVGCETASPAPAAVVVVLALLTHYPLPTATTYDTPGAAPRVILLSAYHLHPVPTFTATHLAQLLNSTYRLPPHLPTHLAQLLNSTYRLPPHLAQLLEYALVLGLRTRLVSRVRGDWGRLEGDGGEIGGDVNSPGRTVRPRGGHNQLIPSRRGYNQLTWSHCSAQSFSI